MKKLRQMISVQGNGNIISKEFKISSFLQLHLSVNHGIEIHHANEEKVVIEMDENLQDYVDVSNSGRTLYVTTDNGAFRRAIFTTCKVKIYYRQLHVINIGCENPNFDCKELLDFPNNIEINLHNVGNTKLRINAPGIKFTNKSVGDVTLEGKCQSLDIKNGSVGNLTTKELIADDVVIKNRSVGELNVFANKSINIGHNGVGSIFYYGAGILKDLKHNWVGVVQHKEL